MSSVVGRSKPFIRVTRPEDIEELSRTMRKEDVEEIFHASGRTPKRSLEIGVRASMAPRTIEWDGKVVAIFGVVGTPGVAGAPWMLGTDDLRRCWSLLRECRERLEVYTEVFHYLTNMVWSKNEVHINWIKWLGFRFEGSSVHNGEVFLHFHRTKDV